MRVAVAAYPVERLAGVTALEAKLDSWFSGAAAQGADLAVFPEYAGIEVALAVTPPVSNSDGALDERAQTLADFHRSAEQAQTYLDLVTRLAGHYGLYVVAGSLPVLDRRSFFNRAYVVAPNGRLGWQDKCILTPWERENTPLDAGSGLQRFDTPFGSLGILICYDCEFPLLARALGVDLLAVPSCTDSFAGQSRVRVSARARALEGQCVSFQAPLLGGDPACPLVDINHGQAGIFGPPDLGFPDDGVLAQGDLDCAGWVLADIDLEALAQTRERGAVAPRRHWSESAQCALRDPKIALDPDVPLK